MELLRPLGVSHTKCPSPSKSPWVTVTVVWCFFGIRQLFGAWFDINFGDTWTINKNQYIDVGSVSCGKCLDRISKALSYVPGSRKKRHHSVERLQEKYSKQTLHVAFSESGAIFWQPKWPPGCLTFERTVGPTVPRFLPSFPTWNELHPSRR